MLYIPSAFIVVTSSYPRTISLASSSASQGLLPSPVTEHIRAAPWLGKGLLGGGQHLVSLLPFTELGSE